MFGKFNWNKVKVTRYSVVIFTLLMIAGIQGCNMGPCLNTVFAKAIVFVIISGIVAVAFGWIPIVGQILVIILIGYTFKFTCLDKGEHGINKKCGCSAFCQTIKTEKPKQTSGDIILFQGGENESEK